MNLGLPWLDVEVEMRGRAAIATNKVTEAILGHCACRIAGALSWYPGKEMLEQEEQFNVVYSCVCAKCGLTILRTARP